MHLPSSVAYNKTEFVLLYATDEVTCNCIVTKTFGNKKSLLETSFWLVNYKTNIGYNTTKPLKTFQHYTMYISLYN